MNEPRHHIPDPIIAAYAAGTLGQPFAVVVATHISMCDECRARYETHLTVGGAVLETLEGAEVSEDIKMQVMSLLDDLDYDEEPEPKAKGLYPVPLSDLIADDGPSWKRLGMGAKQSILWKGEEGSLRLLYIPAGKPVPEHSHGGTELTLVLQGSFSDAAGRFDVGDVEVANEDVQHIPTAGPEMDCICVAATDAPLQFNALMPRLLQPLLKI